MNIKTTPKDFFVQIGATIALYSSVIALINLAFEIINRLLPDQLSSYFSVNSVVWPISVLIALVPVLYLLEWLIARDIAKVAEKSEIWVRRWRIYLTLFLTGATMVGDIIALINTYLNGEISSRFMWKVAILFIICSAVFKYFFFLVYESARWTKLVKKTVPWFGIIFVVSAIIGGLIIVGSPAQQRAIRFDQQRVSDLQDIQYQIINYWQKKQSLPVTLADLNDPILNFLVPVDPETGVQYQYVVKSSSSVPSFSLCSNFDLSSTNEQVNSYPVEYDAQPVSNWKYSTGQSCFDRTIDPAMYPPASAGPINPVK